MAEPEHSADTAQTPVRARRTRRPRAAPVVSQAEWETWPDENLSLEE
jgi:hypothetical protein